MIERDVTDSIDIALEDPEAFLVRRGIGPDNGAYSVEQLTQELTRRGWRWRSEPGTIQADKAYTPTGTVSQSMVSHNPDERAAFASVLAGAIWFDEKNGLSLAKNIPADIVVRARDGRIVAIGEVKGGHPLTDGLAAEIRRNIVRRASEYALAPFFLLVTRETGYLWDQRAGVYPWTKANLRFSMEPVVKGYLPWLRAGERPGPAELGLATANWLQDLADQNPWRQGPGGGVFAETEFLVAIQGASVESDARV